VMSVLHVSATERDGLSPGPLMVIQRGSCPHADHDQCRRYLSAAPRAVRARSFTDPKQVKSHWIPLYGGHG
jgi:hypothetical protein